ncbi:hypothetical protein ASE63_12710 [Bosea sp. Root381]|uniref:invasion associated locus B family protein n=1 Tax=Bosea sp. Root381 TaxID=1736524 RepID=UPI0006F3C698|nr:invasion associated locus B family protein [Bosea sp. Root381]KRD95869.1 hypothetical protein ASE63_12710 [Bosea sp. Root381]
MPFRATQNAKPIALSAALALAALALTCNAALSQPAGAPRQNAQAAPAAPAVPAGPSQTTASFGDWTLRCQRLVADKPERACEVAQTFQVQGQSAPLAQFAIGRTGKGEPLRATAVVPANVSFPSNVQVAMENDGALLDLSWRRCMPGGCIADVVVKDEQFKSWRAATERGRLGFTDATGRAINLPLSFNGLGQALDALSKEAL